MGMTYRRGHHSTSDDATRYRGGAEVKTISQLGLEPISRLRLLLESHGRINDAKEEALRDSTLEEVMSCLKISEGKKFAPVSDMFEDVWKEPTSQLKMQREELFQHLQAHPETYSEKLQRFK